MMNLQRDSLTASSRVWPKLIGASAEMMRVAVVTLWTAVRFLPARLRKTSVTPRGEFAVALARALGPLYIKSIQILAAQSGVLPEGFRREIQDVFDRNEAEPFTTVRRLLEDEYGQPLESIFAAIDAEAIGVGSVAQVHSGQLRDGQRVAVKVLKPAARKSLTHAINAAEILVRISSLVIDRLRPLQLTENFADIRDALLRQTDLAAERAAQEEIGRLFADDPGIVVPRIHGELCTDSILVMDLVEGLSVHRISEFKGDRTALARRMQEAFFSSIYLWGKFHVDPHPGNILVLPSGQVALIDFGMTGELTEANRQQLRTFNSASVMRLWPQAANYFLAGMVVGADIEASDTEFRRRVADVIQHHFDQRQNRWSTAAFLSDMSPVLRSHNLRLRVDMALLVLSLATAEGVLHLVDPDVDLWGNARRFVEEHV